MEAKGVQSFKRKEIIDIANQMYQKVPSDKNQKMPCGPDYYEAIKELTKVNYARNMRVEAMLVQK